MCRYCFIFRISSLVHEQRFRSIHPMHRKTILTRHGNDAFDTAYSARIVVTVIVLKHFKFPL